MEEEYRVCLFQREWNRHTEFISSNENERGVQNLLVPKRMEEVYTVQSLLAPKKMEEVNRVY
jgi:hypothetical protein